MRTETWLDHMYKEIEKQKNPGEEQVNVKLSESDMNNLADIMIKKMADNPKSDDKPDTPPEPATNKPKSADPDETPLD